MQRSCLVPDICVKTARQHMYSTTTVPDIYTSQSTPHRSRMPDRLTMDWTDDTQAIRNTEGPGGQHPVRDHPGQPGGRQRPIAADETKDAGHRRGVIDNSRCEKRSPNTDCSISDAVRWRLIAYCCNTATSMKETGVMLKLQCHVQGPCRDIACSHSAGGRPSRRAVSGAPTNSETVDGVLVLRTESPPWHDCHPGK